MEHYDIAITGGGPAGASAARHAALLGLKTILLEKAFYPREKPCGGALSARCLPLLGEEARRTVNAEVKRLRLFGPSLRYFEYTEPTGYFILRSAFDAAMARDAAAAGAEILEGTQASAIEPRPGGGVYVRFGRPERVISAQCAVSACGFSRKGVAHTPAVPERFEPDYLAMTVVSESPAAPDPTAPTGVAPLLAIFFGAVPNGYGWFFQKDGYINIGVGATARLLAAEGALPAYRRFVTVLRDMGYIPGDMELARERVYPLPFKHTQPRTVFGDIMLAGDSAGFVSPVTGEGLYYAIKSGELTARAAADFIREKKPLQRYHEMCLREFGDDLNRFGYPLREMMYRSERRMELAVTLGRHDSGMAARLSGLIMGQMAYGKGTASILFRLPLALAKVFFHTLFRRRLG